MILYRKKIILLSILLVILLGLHIHRFWDGRSRSGDLHGANSRRTSQKVQASPHDPLKLRLDLLEPGKIETGGSSRNLFGSGDEEVKVAATVKPVAPDVPPAVKPPELELPDLKYIGFVESAGARIGFFTKGQAPLKQILMVKINEQVEGRFRLTSITADWVTFCNVNSGKESRLEILERTSLPAGSTFRPSPPRTLPRVGVPRATPMARGFSRPEAQPGGHGDGETEEGVGKSF